MILWPDPIFRARNYLDTNRKAIRAEFGRWDPLGPQEFIPYILKRNLPFPCIAGTIFGIMIFETVFLKGGAPLA